MKRNAFVLVLLILIIVPTGCRRRRGLFGHRHHGAPCGTHSRYPSGVAPTQQCPPVSNTMYGGDICGGTMVDGGVINGGVINGSAIDGGVIQSNVIDGGIINGGIINEGNYNSSINGAFPAFGNESVPANLVPSLGVSNVYGRPMFQVVGDRQLAPGETLPAAAGVSPPTQSDKTAKAPSKK